LGALQTKIPHSQKPFDSFQTFFYILKSETQIFSLNPNLKMSENQSQRPSLPQLDAILGKQFKCLDKGFVRLIDYMGSDAAIVQAARVSYGAGTKQVRQDRGLIRYLLRHQHTSPFEMVEFKFHCKMPIFVARQWIRHRTASVNEYSLRYSHALDEFYLPEPEMIRKQSASNR